MDPDVSQQTRVDEVVVTKSDTQMSRGNNLRKIFAADESPSAPDGDAISTPDDDIKDDVTDNTVESDAFETKDDEVEDADKAIEYVAVETIDKAAKYAVEDGEDTEPETGQDTDDSANDTDLETVEEDNKIETDGGESLREEESAFLVYGTEYGCKLKHAPRAGHARQSSTSGGIKKKSHAPGAHIKTQNKTTEAPHRVAAYLDERSRFFEWSLQELIKKETQDKKRGFPPKTQAQLEARWSREMEEMWSDHSVWNTRYPKSSLLM